MSDLVEDPEDIMFWQWAPFVTGISSGVLSDSDGCLLGDGGVSYRSDGPPTRDVVSHDRPHVGETGLQTIHQCK